MSLSKRERQAAEEARAQKLREEARATLKQKGITYDNAAAKRDFSNVRKKYDNTLELIKKRKLEKLSQNSKAAERAATNSGSAPSALVGHKKQRKVVKEAAQTKFGIPENSKAYSSRPPKDWVLVKQEHTGDYYFWNKRTNSTMRKMPSESLECVDQNLNNESDDEDENADGTASGTSQTHLINMEPISIPIFMGDSVQSSLKLEVKVGFKINDQKNLNSGLDKIEENQQQFKMLERYMPKLQDAFFIDLISYVPRLYRRYSKLDTKLVANRLKAIGQRTIGEGKILSIDVKTSEEQEPSEQ